MWYRQSKALKVQFVASGQRRKKGRKTVLRCELLAACLSGADLPRAKVPSTDVSRIYSSGRSLCLYSAYAFGTRYKHSAVLAAPAQVPGRGGKVLAVTV